MTSQTNITVEFLGMPRQIAGCEQIQLCANTLVDVLDGISKLLPEVGARCIHESQLRAGYLAGINAKRFVTDPATELTDGDCVQIMSADVGG